MKLQLKNVTLLTTGKNGYADTFALNACLSQAEFGDVVYLFNEPSITGYWDYSRFIIQDLHKHFHTDFVLLIQWDSCIVNPSSWSDEFFNYDFIGAPLDYDPTPLVGCGGFSLRSKKLCLATSMIYEDLKKHNNFYDGCIASNYGGSNTIKDLSIFGEDSFISWMQRHRLEAMGIKIAPIEIAEKFAWEWTTKRRNYSNSFGYHGWHGLNRFHENGDKATAHSCAACILRKKFLETMAAH